MGAVKVPYLDTKHGRLYEKPDGARTTDKGEALRAHRAATGRLGMRGSRGGARRKMRGGLSAEERTHSGSGAYTHGEEDVNFMSAYQDEIAANVTERGGIQTRDSLDSVKTPIGLAAIVHAAAGTINQVTNVQQTIPAGSELWIANMAAGDTMDAVAIDGQGLFVMNPLEGTFLNPANNMAIGFFIEREITQTIAVQTTAVGAVTHRPVLYVRSIEFLQRTGALRRCRCLR